MPAENVYTEDYITEQGSNGIWKYRKWNSGFVECWGKTVITQAPQDGTSTNPAYSETVYLDLPFSIYDKHLIGIAGNLTDICNPAFGYDDKVGFRLKRMTALQRNTDIYLMVCGQLNQEV